MDVVVVELCVTSKTPPSRLARFASCGTMHCCHISLLYCFLLRCGHLLVVVRVWLTCLLGFPSGGMDRFMSLFLPIPMPLIREVVLLQVRPLAMLLAIVVAEALLALVECDAGWGCDFVFLIGFLIGFCVAPNDVLVTWPYACKGWSTYPSSCGPCACSLIVLLWSASETYFCACPWASSPF